MSHAGELDRVLGNVTSSATSLALLLYAYSRGQRSSRRIEQACAEDIAHRVICVNEAPDHTTIARFRQRHEDGIAGLFSDVRGSSPPLSEGCPSGSKCQAGRARLPCVGLHGRTQAVGVGAEHAAVAWLRTQPLPAAVADVEELAGVGRHLLFRRMAARRARDGCRRASYRGQGTYESDARWRLNPGGTDPCSPRGRYQRSSRPTRVR